jgi:3-deoxy-D-manno-octulosonate cytidylyltransferase
MSVVVAIPARLRSTRLPDKVLARVGDRTMVEHAHDVAVRADCGRVLVLTDSDEVAHVVRGFGGEVLMTDPDLESGTARIASVIDQIDAEIVVNLQADSPLLEPCVIAQAASQSEWTGAAVTLPVYPLESDADVLDPAVVKVVRAADGRVLYCSRSPIPYVRDTNGTLVGQAAFWGHAGVYAYRADFLRAFPTLAPSSLEDAERLEQLRWLEAGVRLHSFVVPPQPPSVDTPADLERVRALLAEELVG